MAKAKKEEQITLSQDLAPDYKNWNEKTNDERALSIAEYSKSIIAKSIGEKKMFWDKDMTKEQIDRSMPFNGATGLPYNGVSNLLLRAVSEMNGYEKPQFLTMQQANLMGGTLKKELDENGKEQLTKNGKTLYVKGVKVAFYKQYEYKPKLDSQGKEMLRNITDKDGNPKLGKDGKPLPPQVVMEKVFLEKPILETVTLYHASQFDNLKQDKLKEIILEPLQNFREKQQDKPYDIRPKIEGLSLGKKVSADLNNFLTSQIKGIDYKKIQHLEQDKTLLKGLDLTR